jgi:hypothetical protein
MIRFITRFCCISLLCTAPLSYITAAPFTIAVIGDQQVPVKGTTYYPSFTVQTDWIATNAQANKIRFVTQVGDIVENGNSITQWDRAEAAMVTLDTATNADGGTGIPWNVNYGNHEQDSTQAGTDPAGAWAHNYRDYFGNGSGTHRYAGQPEYGGVSSNDLNTWHIIRSSAAGGAREYLMLNLEYDTPGHAVGSTPDPADVPAFDAIAWAQGIIDSHPGMPTIITTHVFEGTAHGPPGNPYTSGPGRNSQLEIFDKLVKDNSQIFMVLSGHTSQDTHQVKTNTAGLKVLQMVTDYNKVRANGGDGFFRLVELDEDAGEIRVKTYTPGVPQNPTPRYDTSANGQFTIALDWSTRFVPPPSGPIMGTPSSSVPTHEGATAQCQLGNADATSVTLVWALADQGASDIPTWTDAAGGGSHAFGAAVTNDVLSHAITGLSGDTRYYFRFFATDGTDSDWSNVASFVTGLGGLSAPANFNGTPGTIVGGTKVDLSWTDSYTNETGFLLRRSTDPAFGSYQEFSVGANETSYTDESTAANTTYYYRVAAVGSTGSGTFTSNLTVATSNAGAGPVAGLIAHWKFDENSGTTAADSSGSGLTATTTATTTWIAGKSGNAALNPKFTLADSSSLALANGNTAFTISLWAKQTTQNSFAVLAGFDGTGNSGDRYAVKTSSGNIQATTGGAIAATSLVTAGPDGTWLHIVAVNDPTAGNSKVYVNGTLDGTGSVVNLSSTTSQFTMGTYWNSNSYDLNGALDDVQVYNKALTPAEISLLYNNPGTPLMAANPTFSQWMAGYNVGADTGFNQDPDGDGIDNGLEAWFGTGPDTFTAGLTTPAANGLNITFSHTLNEQAPSDISGVYQWSPDLSNWYAGDGTEGPPSGLTVTIAANTSSNTANVTATASETYGNLFFRVKVDVLP